MEAILYFVFEKIHRLFTAQLQLKMSIIVRLIQIQMQQKEILGRKLQKLQEECINDYFESKLETITSKEVIRDIIEGFVAINNQQFFQSIAQSVDSVKKENQALCLQIKELKQTHLLEMQTLQEKLKESQLRLQNQVVELTQQFQDKISIEKRLLVQRQVENSKLLKTVEGLAIKSSESQLKLANIGLQLKQSKQKTEELAKQNSKLTLQLQKTKQSSLKFKQSCQKLLKQANKQREIAKDRLIQNWGFQKEAYELRQQQLTNMLQNKQKQYLSQKATQNEQYQTKISVYQLQIESIKDKIQQLSAQEERKSLQLQKLNLINQELSSVIKDAEDNLSRVQQQKESIGVANHLLQEQNKYLRSTIISFDERYKILEEEKIRIQRSFERFKAEKYEQIERLRSQYSLSKQQSKQEMQRTINETEKTIKQIASELQFLKQREQLYKQNQTKLESKLQQYQVQLSNYQQENKCLSQQLKLHFSDTQLHQNEVKLYQSQIVKLNQDFRGQIQLQKQIFQTNWNTLNEQLLQEKYKKAILAQQVQKYREEIALHQEKERHYKLYHQELGQLKAQLQLINTYEAQSNSKGMKFMDFKSKYYFYISKANQDIKKMKKENKYLKETVFNYIKDYQNYMEEIFSVTILKIREQSLKCLLCEHQKSFKSPEKMNNEPTIFKKTLPKLANNEGMNYSNIKKALKNINQRYQAINQENKQYTDHIDGVIRNS